MTPDIQSMDTIKPFFIETSKSFYAAFTRNIVKIVQMNKTNRRHGKQKKGPKKTIKDKDVQRRPFVYAVRYN